MYVIAHQGGAFKAIFGVPILRHLVGEQEPDLLLGQSAGAINMVAAAQGDFEILEKIWKSVDGMHSFLKPALTKGKAFFSLEPLKEKLDEHISLEKLKVQFGCGAVARETKEYHTFMSNRMQKSERLIDSVLASSSITGLLEPVVMKHGGKNQTFCDGGHKHSIPPIPIGILPKVTAVDIILCNPLEDEEQSSSEVTGIVESIEWFFQTNELVPQTDDLAYYRLLAKQGVRVRVFAPKESLGSALQADPKTMQERWDLGLEAIDNPVIWGE